MGNIRKKQTEPISVNADKSLIKKYYDDGKLCSVHDYTHKCFIAYDKSGEKKFEFTPQKTYINSKYYKQFKLGVKNLNAENHWQEDTAVNPHIKTIVFFGGKGTYNAQHANGYTNSAIEMFGIKNAQLPDVQLVSCYRFNWKSMFNMYLRETGADFDLDLWEKNITRKEILLKFMPFMANKQGDSWERLPPQELLANFRNIMLVSHCYGANDLVSLSAILRQTMTKLGYSEDIQRHALKQIVCITNNNWRDFSDKNGFTTYHRYSVFDGQAHKSYPAEYSDDYPVFLEKHLPFHKFNGRQGAFVNLNKDEMLMVFDKVIKYGGCEHNDAFLVADGKLLTNVGKLQARITKQLGQFWLQNRQNITSAADFLLKSVKNTNLEKYCDTFLQNGRKLQKLKINPLHNPSIISAAYNKYKSGVLSETEHGVYKLLSPSAKQSVLQENTAYLLHCYLTDITSR